MSGRYTIVSSGWRGHAISYTFAWPYAVRANRLHLLARHVSPWHVLCLRTPDQLEDLLTALRRSPFQPWSHAWLQGRRLQWRARVPRKDRLRQQFAATPLAPQHRSNCAIASAKAAVLALFVLHAQQNHAVQPYELYKDFTTFLRYRTWVNYISPATRRRCGMADAVLVQGCAQRIARESRARRMPNQLWLAQVRAARQRC